jgi:hypothetical protein
MRAGNIDFELAQGILMKVFSLLIIAAVLFSAWPVAASSKLPDTNALRAWHNREIRVAAITLKILAANIESCPKKSPQYGLVVARLDDASSLQLRTALTEALGLRDDPIAMTVVPGGAAELAGIRAGDRIVAIEGIKWPTENAPNIAARKPFWDALQSGQQSAAMKVYAKRGEQPIEFNLVGQLACAASVVFINQRSANATTFGSRIEIHSGLEALLQDDAELAFAISHELAHVILEHTGPGKEKNIKDKLVRQRIETEADHLGMLLMARAGFDTASAPRAVSRIYQTNGPISRLLGLHGAYMSTNERNAFLSKRANEVRLQLESEAGKR